MISTAFPLFEQEVIGARKHLHVMLWAALKNDETVDGKSGDSVIKPRGGNYAIQALTINRDAYSGHRITTLFANLRSSRTDSAAEESN